MVRVGPGERDDEWYFDAVRQTKRQRADTVGVKSVDQCRAVGLDLGFDRRGVDRGEIPEADLDAALGETQRDSRDGRCIASAGRRTERREQRPARRHRREHIATPHCVKAPQPIWARIPRTRPGVYI